MATLLDVLGRELANVWNAYVSDAVERWDHIYARGFGEAVDGASPRARHYVIAGIVADVAGHAPRVLDVGCGFGTTYRLLRRLEPTYEGIDRSARAVQRCRDHYGEGPCCSFEVADFERHAPRGTFDVVILNELLRIVPLRRARAVVGKAIAHLSGPRGVLVISHDRPLDMPLVQAACREVLPEPLHRIGVQSRPRALLRGRWTVTAYTSLKDEVEEERVGPPVSGVDGPVVRWRERVS
jgi:2-polyprenyl-3-methyl-5-hydroxy-6-metoxy-1,4-benzoquinol methylase